MPGQIANGCTVVPGTDTTTLMKLPSSVAYVAVASGNNILGAAGAGIKHRIFTLTLTVDTAGLVTISDYTTLKAYLPANGSITFDFSTVGALQGTAATAITATNSGGGNFTAAVVYRDE